MRIALDATPLTVSTGGIRRYTEELSGALARCYPEEFFYLISDQQFEMPQPRPANLLGGYRPHNRLEQRWWLWGVQRELSRIRANIFHGTDFTVPYLKLRPSVITLHDLSPWRDPSWHTGEQRVRDRTPYLLRLNIATMVITPSEAIRREAIEHFHLAPDRVTAIPLASSIRPQPVAARENHERYFLFVGTLEPRKNLQLLIAAWRHVWRSHGVPLILAGRTRSDFGPIPNEPGLTLRGPVADNELPALYAGALACVYPSLYEGFGLPVLEAMQCGAPVIASRDPAIAEAAGDAALLVEASDEAGWVQALSMAASCPERLQQMRERGLSQAARFSWEATARRTYAVYQEALHRHRLR